jgi:hypothetical protein
MTVLACSFTPEPREMVKSSVFIRRSEKVTV